MDTRLSTLVSVNCDFCGKSIPPIKPSDFKRRKHHFCDRKCFGKWKSENQKGKNNPFYKGKVAVECSLNGCTKKTREMYPSELKKSEYHFCSGEHLNLFQSEIKIGENHRSWTGDRITVECAWRECIKTKEVGPNELQKRENFFCTREHAGLWRSENLIGENNKLWKGKITVNCANCWKPVGRYPCHVKRNDHIFCNRKCQGEYLSKNNCGKNNPSWDGGKITVECSWSGCSETKDVSRYEAKAYDNHFCDKNHYNLWQIETGEKTKYCNIWRDPDYKEFILERDNHECQNPECWHNTDHLPLHIHHIDYNGMNCSPENVITVCNSCNGRANKNRDWHTVYYQGIMFWNGKLRDSPTDEDLNNAFYLETNQL